MQIEYLYNQKKYLFVKNIENWIVFFTMQIKSSFFLTLMHYNYIYVYVRVFFLVFFFVFFYCLLCAFVKKGWNFFELGRVFHDHEFLLFVEGIVRRLSLSLIVFGAKQKFCVHSNHTRTHLHTHTTTHTCKHPSTYCPRKNTHAHLQIHTQ